MLRRLERMRLEQALADHDPFKASPRTSSPGQHSRRVVRAPARPGARRPGRPSGSGKSTWAGPATAARRSSPPTPCAASSAAGRTTSTPPTTRSPCSRRIVAARLGRGLTTVVDTLGIDARAAAGAGSPRPGRPGCPRWRSCSTPPTPSAGAATPTRDRPVPGAGAGRASSSGTARYAPSSPIEGWDVVHVVDAGRAPVAAERRSAADPPDRRAPHVAGAARSCSRCRGSRGARTRPPGCRRSRGRPTRPGSPGSPLMDHLIQIPQVGRAWEPIPEPWVTLGAGRRARHRARLGTLVTPVTFRPAGHHRQGGRHPRRAHRRPGVRRRRRGLVGARARGVRAGLPARPRAARRARGRDRDHAGAVGARHQGVRRRRGQPARDDLATRGRPARSR